MMSDEEMEKQGFKKVFLPDTAKYGFDFGWQKEIKVTFTHEDGSDAFGDVIGFMSEDFLDAFEQTAIENENYEGLALLKKERDKRKNVMQNDIQS